jgi:hypothetical protein
VIRAYLYAVRRFCHLDGKVEGGSRRPGRGVVASTSIQPHVEDRWCPVARLGGRWDGGAGALDGRDAVVDGVTLVGNWWWGTESLEKDGCFFPRDALRGEDEGRECERGFPGGIFR